ncbi:hypothetical protein SAY86_001234 [Trapa natans]|uniref:Uncharacterized protein n=1 Tax=Trapa natans TaxID=22666 RepID=A0AAN7N0J3_TRANT|nr:hypothetical protein SAY86_001234 [Trapa natans]
MSHHEFVHPGTPTDDHTQSMIRLHHTPELRHEQCGSVLVQTIDAPLSLVWSLVGQFGYPQAYKQFIKTCKLVVGDGTTKGSIREIAVVTGMPASWSREVLEVLDDDAHVMIFSIIGGDHRLVNYRSTTTAHERQGVDGRRTTVVIESYVVNVAEDNTEEETRSFAETIIRCNLRWLARVSEKMACTLGI